MNKFMSLLLLLIICGSCRNNNVIDGIFRYPPSGMPEADTLFLNYKRNRYFDFDPVVVEQENGRYASAFCSIAERHKDNEILQIRSGYLKALQIEYTERDSFEKAVKRLLIKTDSTRYPYDYHILRSLEYEIETDIVRKYNIATGNIAYFSAAGSGFEEGVNLILAGNVMSELRDTLLALQFFNKADEIYSSLDIPHGRRITANNIALLSPDSVRDSIFRRLLADPDLERDPQSHRLVLHNLFIRTDSIPLLEKAMEIYRTRRVDASNMPLTMALIGQYHNLHGSPLKALTILNEAIDSTHRYAPGRAAIYHTIYTCMADSWYILGEKDSCIEMLSRARYYRDKQEKDISQAGVYAADAAERIRLLSEKAALEQKRSKDIILIIILLFSIITVWLVMVMKKRRVAREYKERLANERLERTLHSMRAQAKVMEESDRLAATLEEKIDELKTKARISEESAASMMTILRIHKSNEENRQGFLQMQKELDTRFLERLRKDFPSLPESQYKLASLIAAGLDSRQIGSILNIEQASVHKSRYRLRTRLGLTKDQSLDEFLRRYNTLSGE